MSNRSIIEVMVIKQMFPIKIVLKRRKLCQYLRFGIKMGTVVFWVLLYFVVMKLTIFKSDVSPPSGNIDYEWNGEPDDNKDPVVPVTESDPLDTYQDWSDSNDTEATLAELQAREARVHRVCEAHMLTSQDINHKEFFIDSKHGLVWCNIFKAASSYWLNMFNIIGGYNTSMLARSRRPPLELARRKFARPTSKQILNAVNTPGVISLLVVREPFVRLLSAYRDKLEYSRLKYYRQISKSIVKRHRENATKIFGPIKSLGPTFYEFVAELIRTQGDMKDTYNEHWMPYHQFCSPCAVNFSVIAKVETLKRDSAFVIKKLGLGTIFKNKRERVINKSHDKKNTATLLKSYFKQLDKHMLNDLLKIYGTDFEMFGYDSDIYNDYVRK